jgi:opacity protein-like surface antigen
MVRRVAANRAWMTASAVALGTLCMSSTLDAQNGSLLPQFSNTVMQPMHTNSPSVSMRLNQKKSSSAETKPSPYRSSPPPRLGMKPKSFLDPFRHRRQDGDVFGEDQAGSDDPFGESTVESPIQESPFAPFNSGPFRKKKAPVVNPFGEPEIEEPVVDPAPRVPPMDTVPKKPVLPPGAEFTPDQVPELPKPDGSTRESDTARTERSVPDPDEVTLEDFTDESLQEDDPDARRGSRATRRREREAAYDDPRRPFRSNVYRPAPEPTYYSKALPGDGRPNYASNSYAAAAGPNAYNPYAANPYAPNPYGTNPYPAPYAAPYPAPYPTPYPAPYAMNPYMGYGCPPACMGCQSCQSCAPTNCCPPTNAYAGCPTPTPADCDDVYENVVSQPARSGVCGLGLNLCNRGSNSILTPSGVPLYYFSLFGGWSDLSDLEIANEQGTINFDSPNGFGFGGAFGQIQGRNLRSELEFSYRSHDVEDLLLRDFGGGREVIQGVGDIESYAGMLNVYWEFVDLLGGRIAPYVGAGVGAVNVTADMRLDGGRNAFTDGEDSSFAYQYIIGLNYKVRQYSDLFIEYRHFAADSLRFDTSLPEGSLLDGDGELNFQTNNIFFGMRLKF